MGTLNPSDWSRELECGHSIRLLRGLADAYDSGGRELERVCQQIRFRESIAWGIG